MLMLSSTFPQSLSPYQISHLHNWGGLGLTLENAVTIIDFVDWYIQKACCAHERNMHTWGCTGSASIQRATPYRPLEQEAGTRGEGRRQNLTAHEQICMFFLFFFSGQTGHATGLHFWKETKRGVRAKISTMESAKPVRHGGGPASRTRDFSHLLFKTVNLWPLTTKIK